MPDRTLDDVPAPPAPPAMPGLPATGRPAAPGVALGEEPADAGQPALSGTQPKSTRYPARDTRSRPWPSTAAPPPSPAAEVGPGAGSPVAGSPATWSVTLIRAGSVPAVSVTVTEPGPPNRQGRPETLTTMKYP
ncbi:hypothetical protein ACFQ0M_23560 [Kitasatospora aburaviensis]